jgi:hypothetical protein
MASQAIKFHVHRYSSIYLNRHGNGTSVNPNPVDSSQGRIIEFMIFENNNPENSL